MRVFTGFYPDINEPFAVCIGKFDGVHTGHRLILDTLIKDARQRGVKSVVYSFEPYNGTPRLTSREEKERLFKALGADILIVAELSGEFMATPPEQFIKRLAACGGLKAVTVGRDFRFGAGASGDVGLLMRLGAQMGFEVCALDPVTINDMPVSSTAIRDAVKSGDVALAARMLGREYALAGEVTQGRRLARQMGYNTANLLPPHGKVMPANGVYAAYADVDGRAWPAMTNIGVKPTINGKELLIESHLIGFEGELYGKTVTVRLVKRIRDEIKFKNVDELAAQLGKDYMQVNTILQNVQI